MLTQFGTFCILYSEDVKKDILTIDRWRHIFTKSATNAIWTNTGVTAVWVLEAAMFTRTLEFNMLARFWNKIFYQYIFYEFDWLNSTKEAK